MLVKKIKNQGQVIMEAAVAFIVLIPILLLILQVTFYYTYYLQAVDLSESVAQVMSVSAKKTDAMQMLTNGLASISPGLAPGGKTKDKLNTSEIRLLDIETMQPIDVVIKDFSSSSSSWQKGDGLVEVVINIDLPSNFVTDLFGSSLSSVNVSSRRTLLCTSVKKDKTC